MKLDARTNSIVGEIGCGKLSVTSIPTPATTSTIITAGPAFIVTANRRGWDNGAPGRTSGSNSRTASARMASTVGGCSMTSRADDLLIGANAGPQSAPRQDPILPTHSCPEHQ